MKANTADREKHRTAGSIAALREKRRPMPPCDKVQLPAETEPIIHDTWEPYSFTFTAESDWRYLILEAYYNTNEEYPYCGNLLVDNICSLDN